MEQLNKEFDNKVRKFLKETDISAIDCLSAFAATAQLLVKFIQNNSLGMNKFQEFVESRKDLETTTSELTSMMMLLSLFCMKVGEK